MADHNERVMEMVRRELDRNPEVDLGVLFEKAREIDPAVGELNRRQFHARYPLQVKRSRSGGRRKKAARKGGRAAAAPRSAARQPGGAPLDRDALREVFLEFASDFAQAESRQEIVRVLSSVDAYVDRVQKLAARK